MSAGPIICDALGVYFRDGLNSQGSLPPEIIERDDGYIFTSRTFNYFAKFAEWVDWERDLSEHAYGRILDAGCGVGRHSLYYQGKGMSVTAIDICSGAIEICRQRGVQDARELGLEAIARLKPLVFDTIALFGHNLFMLASPKKAHRILRRLKEVTRPGAIILGTNLDPCQLQEPAHRTYHQINRYRSRMPGRYILRIRYKNMASPWFRALFMSKDELVWILEGTGWVIEQFFESGGPSYGVIIRRNQ